MDRFQQLRLLEAILFATAEPVREKDIAARMPDDADIKGLLEELQGVFANRGVNLCSIGDAWAFRTAEDLATYMRVEKETPRKLSRAGMETLAIIAYHQPVTRGEIEEIRGVAVSRGTIDILLEAGWVKPRGRKRVPGKPITWGTTDAFLDEFGLEDLKSLPGVEELKASGLLDSRPGVGSIAMRQSESGLADSESLEEETEDEFAEGDDPFLDHAEEFEALETDETIALDD